MIGAGSGVAPMASIMRFQPASRLHRWLCSVRIGNWHQPYFASHWRSSIAASTEYR
jgi:hypothetical protein